MWIGFVWESFNDGWVDEIGMIAMGDGRGMMGVEDGKASSIITSQDGIR